MPNFDGGHYFLTTLTPIRVGAPIDLSEEKRKQFEDGSVHASFVTRVQIALSNMPTALQSPATEKIGVESPFAESLRTHFCRFVVIEDAVFNGRESDNTFLTSAGLRQPPLEPNHVDQLPCAYLMCCVDFDAVREAGQQLPSQLTTEQQDEIRDHYLEALWTSGSAELLQVYENCQEFDAETIKTSKDFAEYMRRCQIETWMSFNDYYLPNKNALLASLPGLPFLGFAFGIGLPLIAAICCFAAWLWGSATVLGLASGWAALVAAIIAAAAVYFVYSYIMRQGQEPWPAAEFGDLPSVLKGLYLQQRFSDFVVEEQGKTASQLHVAFGQFLKDHQPDDVLDPRTTQAPGVIKS